MRVVQAVSIIRNRPSLQYVREYYVVGGKQAVQQIKKSLRMDFIDLSLQLIVLVHFIHQSILHSIYYHMHICYFPCYTSISKIVLSTSLCQRPDKSLLLVNLLQCLSITTKQNYDIVLTHKHLYILED